MKYIWHILILLLPAIIHTVSGQAVPGQTSSADGQPPTVSWQTETVSGQPANASGQPETVSGQPETASGRSANASGQPLTASGLFISHDPCWDSLTHFDDFFEREEPLYLTLKFDLKGFQRTKKEEPYVDAMLYCKVSDSCSIPYEVELRTRGIFRKSYCFLPPFWMKIEDACIESSSLYGVEKMKIVTHCMNRASYQDYLLKEYLAYKIYNIISPYSFRVRLLRITYIDTGRNNKIYEGWAFAIEPKEMLAERINATLVEDDELAMKHMNAEVMDRLAMFNYMIGNTDYSITGTHNVKIYMMREQGLANYIPVPYDFDFTGIVNAIYANPAEQANISEVTQRYYTGPCRPEKVFSEVLEEFREHSHKIHELLQSFEYMHLDEKMKMLRFIEGFFDEAASEEFLFWKINISCK